MSRILPVLRIDLAGQAPADLAALFSVAVGEVRLEIGFGGGEHLLHEAAAAPRIGFIGVEPFENGMAKAVAAIEQADRRNVRLSDEDAGLVLDWLPDGALARIDLLYPDPWPKLRHRKRRFVRDVNLERIARVLAPGGTFRFATDVESYAVWTIRAIARHGRLAWTAESLDSCRTPWEGWPGTRYEEKALAEGRRPAYLTFENGASGGTPRIQSEAPEGAQDSSSAAANLAIRPNPATRCPASI